MCVCIRVDEYADVPIICTHTHMYMHNLINQFKLVIKI